MSGILNFTAAVGAIANLGRSDPVILGTISLTGMEVPDTMRVGGQQRLAIHNLPGGEKLIDVAGNDDARLELTGRFIGPDALERAQAVEAIRNQGRPVVFSVAGLSWSVFVFEYSYDYTAKGAIIPYRLTLERQETARNKLPPTTKEQSQSAGRDIGTALTSLAGAASNISQTASDFTGQLQTIVGQITPIANIIGIGSPLAQAQTALQKAQAITAAGTDLGADPAGLAALKSNLGAAGDSLMSVIQMTGDNLSNIQITDPMSLLTIAQNTQLQRAAVNAGTFVNRANQTVTAAGGGAQSGPLVHA